MLWIIVVFLVLMVLVGIIEDAVKSTQPQEQDNPYEDIRWMRDAKRKD